MSPRSYGTLAIASTVVELGAAVGGLGLSAAVAQRASALRSRYGDESTQQALVAGCRLAVPATVAFGVVLAVLGIIMPEVAKLKAAWPVVAVMWPMVLVAPLTALLLGALAANFAAFRATVAQLTTILATAALTVIVVVVHARDALDVGIARAVGALAGFAVLARVAPRGWLTLRRRDTGSPVGGSIASFASAMLLTTIAWRAVSQLDIFIVGLERGSYADSLYAPASRLADFALAFATPLATYALPAIARARSELGAVEVRRLYHWSSRWSLLVSAPVLAVMIASPSAMLGILFGARLESVAGPARILGIAAAVHVLFGFNGLALDAQGVPNVAAVRAGLGIAASIVACVLLIPPFGLTGAAVSTLIAIVVLNASSSWTLARRFGIRPWDRQLAATGIGFAATVAGAAILVHALRPPAFWSCALAATLTASATCLVSRATGSPAV